MALSGEALRSHMREQLQERDPFRCDVCGERWEPPEDDLCGETLQIWREAHFRPPGTYEKKLREWRVNKMIEKEWPSK